MKKYSKTHQWVEVVDGIATLGITKYAAEQLGELSFVELPEVGRQFQAGECFGTVESLKAASEIFAPIGGTVSEVNSELDMEPTKVNEDAEGAGWICKFQNVQEAELDALMSEAEYLAFV